MFTQIRTSKENKEVVTKLTRSLNLGAENVIARIAYTYSLSKEIKLDINEISNSSGKEYSRSVLFGEHEDIYIGLVCVNYGIYKKDKDIGKYVKMHIDHGLSLIAEETNEMSNIDGFDFVSNKIIQGILQIN